MTTETTRTAATATGHHRAPAEGDMPARRRPGRTIIALHGDLDLTSAPALREHLLAALRHSARLLILDLDEVSFCDAAGLTVLLGTQRRAAGLGITLSLAAPNPQVAKLLRITGLDRCLTVHPALPDGLTASSAPVELANPGRTRVGAGAPARTR